jgi:hypothetical protein
MPVDLAEASALVQHPPTITVDSFRDEDFSGVIERIYPEPKSLTGVVTYLVDVVITSGKPFQAFNSPGCVRTSALPPSFGRDALLCPMKRFARVPAASSAYTSPSPIRRPGEHETQFVDVRFGLDNGNYSEVLGGPQRRHICLHQIADQARKRLRKRRRLRIAFSNLRASALQEGRGSRGPESNKALTMRLARRLALLMYDP